MRKHVTYNFLFSYRIISLLLILFLTFFQVLLLLEYKLYFPGSVRFAALIVLGIILFLFLTISFLSVFFSDKFYFNFRSFLATLKFSNLYYLYQFLNDLQLKKFIKRFKTTSKQNTSNAYTPEVTRFNFQFIDLVLLLLNLILLVSTFSFNKAYLEAANRIINFHKTFIKPDLLVYTYNPENLEVIENESFDFYGYVTGQYIPDHVIFIYNGLKYKVPVINRSFSFKFKNITHDFNFIIQNLSLNHRRKFSVKCISKIYFENYYLVVNKPIYIGGGTDTIYDFITASLPEFSSASVNLRWHGNASLLVNGMSAEESKNSYSYKFSPSTQFKAYRFDLSYNGNILDSIYLPIVIINDQYPELQIINDANRKSGIISITDDYGLERGFFKLTKIFQGQSYIISASSINFKNSKNYIFYFSDLDSIQIYDTIKVITSIKDNCPFRPQVVNKEFILFTQSDRFASALSLFDSLDRNYQKSLLKIDNLQQVLNRLRNSVENFSKSNYSKEINLQSLKTNVDDLKSLANNNLQIELNKLVRLIDSILQQISNPSLNQFHDPGKLENIKKLIELCELLKDKIVQEQKLTQSQIIEILKKEIDAQLKANNDAIDNLNNYPSEENLFKNVEALQKSNTRLTELANKLKDPNSDILQKQIIDSLNEVNNRYDSLRKSVMNDSKRVDQLSKISKTYQNVSDLLEMTSQNQNEAKWLNYYTLVNLIKRGTLLSQAIENSTYSDFSRFNNNRWFTNPSAQSFSYFEKFWNQYRDSLMTFIRESELPVTFFVENIFRIDQSSEKVRRALRNNNSIEAGKNAGEVMEGLNKITLAITELLEAKEDDNSMQMEGQQCMKPKKGGSKGKPKPSRNLQDVIQQLQQLNQQMNSISTSGKQKSIDGKTLLELVNQQQMLREALSDLINQAENKSLGRLLQMAIEDMKRNEKQLIDQRSIDNSLINRQQNILTRLLESQKAREEQEFENRRESKDFGHYVRSWTEDDYSKPDANRNSFNELLKPNPIGIRKYYQEKQTIYRTFKQ